MSLNRIFVAIAAAGCLALACSRGPRPEPIPEAVPGTYAYDAAGSALGKAWQIGASLNLKPDGTFELTLDKMVGGEKEPTERTSGTYTVSGDKVWVTESKDAGGIRARGSHSLVIRPDSLVGEIGWKDHLVLRGMGIPDPVFVKRGQT
ncbi:MAG TPA: hypothetical protein VNO75_02220 [Gemmatimonadaceae bacterium]|nr:hypothetical protein [Gemmatimonadaceae bacterium]